MIIWPPLESKHMKIKNTTISVIKADITSLEVDAIVNAANNKLLMGGGVAGVIKKKGGQSIEDEAVKKGPITIGASIATKAGKLKCKYVIHSATMGMDFQTDEDKIRASCASALQCADELKIKSVAFPALGCGTGGFPLKGAAKIMAQEVLKFLRHTSPNTTLREIQFCLFDDEAFKIFNKEIPGYIAYIIEELGKGPYVTCDIIIEVNGGIVLIERTNPPFGWALPGGFLDYGESVEECAIREAKEETNLELKDLKQFHTYSEPGRDPRFQTVTVVFTAAGVGKPHAGDDAKGLKVVKFAELPKLKYAFDHNKVIEDYLRKFGK